jgi:hypothetical protein
MDPLTILSMFAPALIEAVKASINRFISPEQFKPANIDDVVKLQEIEIKRFQIMNDSTGASPWVQNVIKMQRPIVAATALMVWSYSELVGHPSTNAQTMAQVIFFYLFGERTLLKTGKTT